MRLAPLALNSPACQLKEDRDMKKPKISYPDAARLHISIRHNYLISVLRPEAKLFGLRYLMIIGTEARRMKY